MIPENPGFDTLPPRAVRAITHALALELLAIDQEDATARSRLSMAAADAAPYQEMAAIIQTIRQGGKDAGAIRGFLERAQLRALGKPGKEVRP